MPLTRPAFVASEEQGDLTALLHQVLSLVKGLDVRVKDIDAKVDALSSEHETLKQQLTNMVGYVRSVDERLQADCEVLRRESAVVSANVEAAGSKLDEVRADYRALSSQVEETSRKAAESLAGLGTEQEATRGQVEQLLAGTKRRADYRPETAEADTQITETEAPGVLEKQEAIIKCMTNECVKHHKPEIKKLVRDFITHRNWDALVRGLDDVLDHSSEAHRQLQAAETMWDVGYYSYSELASLLMCAGLPIDMASSISGGSMLHGAAYGGHLEVVQRLVQAGADTAARDKSGHTALDYARSECHTAVAEYLEQLPY